MEKILYFIWKHKIFPLSGLTTSDGAKIEVLNPGLPNMNAGPDFLQARIKIGDIVWAGNVEIHELASDWYRHGHDTDRAYDNVILHVASVLDTEVSCSNGRTIPQTQLTVPADMLNRYRELTGTLHYPPCYKVVGSMSPLRIHSWLNTLCVERLLSKSERILDYQKFCNNDWENSLFIAISRNFGFGVNGDAFEMWAKAIPYHALGKHRDNIVQIEAIFFGQAGFLSEESLPTEYRSAISKDYYFKQLLDEYRFLSAKFGLKHIEPHLWKYLRLRPANFPHIRIAQLAMLYYKNALSVSRIMDAANTNELLKLLDGGVSGYWQSHTSFGIESPDYSHDISLSSRRLVLINTIVPLLYTYGKHVGNDDVCDKAVALLENLPPENNHILRNWAECGIKAEHAGDSQALIQLKNVYCDRKDCLRCRFGYEFLGGK